VWTEKEVGVFNDTVKLDLARFECLGSSSMLKSYPGSMYSFALATLKINATSLVLRDTVKSWENVMSLVNPFSFN
jgi:hypothetical protein